MTTLITIPMSHFCEKARWGLEHLGVPYQEVCHGPLFSRLATRRYKSNTVPLAISHGVVLKQSAEILRHFDAIAPASRRLYPDDAAERAEVERLEQLFDSQLGPAARRLAYFHLLGDTPHLLGLLRQGIPAWQAGILPVIRPALVGLMRKGMRINPEGARKSTERLQEVFAQVDALLADGRRYLVGDRLTAADITFASLSSPLIMPPQYPVTFPPLTELSREWQDIVAHYRARPAGQLALRLYAQERARA